MPQKFYFLCFVEMKIRPSWACILSFKSVTCEPIVLKFDQLTVMYSSCSKELCLQSLICFLIFEYFFTDICYPYLHLLATKEQYYCNRQNLKIMHFCSQRCQVMNSILTNFCCLFKAGLDSNLQILLVLQKAVHVWNM